MSSNKKPRADFGPIQAPNHLGIPVWKWEAALRRGLIPAADPKTSRWPAAVIEDVKVKLDDILDAVGDQAPIGASRAAERLAERLDMEVSWDDVDQLYRQGILKDAGEYKGWPLYDVWDLDQVADHHASLVADLVAERLAWLASSLSPRDVQARLGLDRYELERLAREKGVEPGRFRRYAVSDVDALADDERTEQIKADRLLGANQAADHLEIRRRDFDYCVAAGWITPATYTEVELTRRKTITVPLYRTGDVDALRDIPGVDWEAVRSVRPGQTSPLREIVGSLPIGRATLVLGFAQDVSEQFHTPVRAQFHEDHHRHWWMLTWYPNKDGQPTLDEVRALINTDRNLRPHASSIELELKQLEAKQ